MKRVKNSIHLGLIAVLAIAVLLSGCGASMKPTAPDTAGTPAPSEDIEVNHGASPFGFLDPPPDKLEYYGDLGIHWLRGGREGYDWGSVEEVEGQYDWSNRSLRVNPARHPI